MEGVAKVVPWRGRQRVDDPRSRFVAVRCTDDEYATITAQAERAGLTTGAYLRAVALGSPGPRAARRPRVELVEVARLLGALGKVGSNVNQLAKMANTTGALPMQTELASISAEMIAMRTALMKALGRGG